MEFTARVSFLRIAPRKVRLLGQSLVGRRVSDALAILSVTVKRSVDPLGKLIRSAVANASKSELKAEHLFIKSIIVDEGPKLKRFRPRAFGRAAEILKRSSHVVVTLTDSQAKSSKTRSGSKSKASAKSDKSASAKGGSQPKADQPLAGAKSSGGKPSLPTAK